MKEMQKDYLQFDLEDFISDDQFTKWAQGKAPQDDAFWASYIQSNPSKRQIISEAKSIIAAIVFDEPEVGDDFFDRLNSRINDSIDHDSAAHQSQAESFTVQPVIVVPTNLPAAETPAERPAVPLTEKKHTLNYKTGIRISIGIAASLLLLLTYVFYPRNIVVENGFAGTRQVILPDSSVVLLNANSSLTYRADWDPSTRHVKLSGEGFFKIRHRVQEGKTIPFQVDLNEVSLHVLGTSFNVINRPAQVEVILKTGRLKVTHKQQEIFMKPADHLIYNQAQKSFVIKESANEDYLDWTRLEFIFNDLTVAQVAEKLSSYFQLKFTFEDESVKNEKLSGRLGMSDQKETLRTLELLLNKKMVVNGMNVTISR